MDSNGGRQMVVNTQKVELPIPLGTTDLTEDVKKKPPAGTVERTLNFQERSLLVLACKLHCAKQDKGDHKAQAKLSRLLKIVSYEETVDYFDMIDDSLEDKLFKWQRERNDWLLVQQYLAGGIALDELKKKSPELDIENPPEKPARRQPEATKDEIRGSERSFYLPSKLDSWVQDVLHATHWPNPEKSMYITELCTKFGIKGDED